MTESVCFAGKYDKYVYIQSSPNVQKAISQSAESNVPGSAHERRSVSKLCWSLEVYTCRSVSPSSSLIFPPWSDHVVGCLLPAFDHRNTHCANVLRCWRVWFVWPPAVCFLNHSRIFTAIYQRRLCCSFKVHIASLQLPTVHCPGEAADPGQRRPRPSDRRVLLGARCERPASPRRELPQRVVCLRKWLRQW